jgi:phosphate-selective porin OprO/OprP
MKSKLIMSVLLATSALVWTSVAQAQQAQPAQADNDADTKVAPEAPATPEDLSSKQAFLEAQLEAMQAQINDLKSQLVKATPTWKGAPQWDDKDAGFSFKVRGRFQYDTAWIENPKDRIVTRDLGFDSRVRRVRLGVEGTLGGGFGYKFEMDYANSTVGFGDAVFTYSPPGRPFQFIVGNHETFESLEQISSSRFISFLERAQMNDAFIHTRRLGVSANYADSTNTLRFGAGLFTAHTIDASTDNDGWIGATRLTYSPQAMGGQLHLGLNAQYRNFQANNGGTASSSSGAPSTNQLARYRARPFLQTTGVRFVDTGSAGFAAKSDTILGVELAGIFKSFHFAGEAQWLKVNAYAPGDIATGLDSFGGANTVLVPTGNPSFFSWYAEVGYYLTGETRGYKNGAWDRTKVLHPFSKGGWGAVQINARYDYLDLDSDKLKFGLNNNFNTGATSAGTSLSRGGKQQGFLASLIWIPEDYVRLMLQFAHTRVTGGPSASTVITDPSKPVDERNFSSNSVATRIQFDF